jgi:hypothetical protein
MSERPTPETDAAWAVESGNGLNEVKEISRKLERERDDYMERCRIALSERDSWRMRAEQKYAMRRELEELLGVDQKDASDEQFQKGLDAIKNIIGERDEAVRLLRDLLAILHSDGGHHTADVGLAVSTLDATKKFESLINERENMRAERDESREQRNCLHELHNKNAIRSQELLELCGTLRKERDEAYKIAIQAIDYLASFNETNAQRLHTEIEIIKSKSK